MPAQDGLDYQVVDPGFYPAGVVTLGLKMVMMVVMVMVVMMMMVMMTVMMVMVTSFSRYFQNVCKLHLCPENSSGASLCSKSSLYLFTLEGTMMMMVAMTMIVTLFVMIMVMVMMMKMVTCNW